jgi:hypothetical protein
MPICFVRKVQLVRHRVDKWRNQVRFPPKKEKKREKSRLYQVKSMARWLHFHVMYPENIEFNGDPNFTLGCRSSYGSVVNVTVRSFFKMLSIPKVWTGPLFQRIRISDLFGRNIQMATIMFQRVCGVECNSPETTQWMVNLFDFPLILTEWGKGKFHIFALVSRTICS